MPLPPLELGIHLPFSPHKVLIKGHSEPDSRKEIVMDWKVEEHEKDIADDMDASGE